MKITFWGVYESDYPRNRIFIDGLKKDKHVDVTAVHVPLLEKDRDKSKKYVSLLNLFFVGIGFISAYFRLLRGFLREKKNTDIWVCGYIGQMDVLVLKIFQTLFRDKKPILFNPLLSLYDTLILDRKLFPAGSLVSKIVKTIDNRSFQAANHIIIDTDAHRDFLCEQFDLSIEKISVIWVGAEPQFFKRRVNLPGAGKKPFVVQFVGKFIPLHGLDIILDAARWFDNEEVVFEVIGSGQLDEWFEEEVKKNNLNNIRHIPWVDYDQLPQVMEKSHVSLGVFSTADKTQRVIPNKVFQALAMGRITISAQSPGLTELQNRGILINAVKPGSGQGLAKSIRLVMENYEEMGDFSKQTRRLAQENFRPSVLVKEFKAVCERVVKESLGY